MMLWKRSLKLTPNKILSLLGMAQKAGKISGGAFQVEQSVKSKKARLVIISEDMSERSAKQYNDMCSYHKVPLVKYGDMESLGHAIGKEYRAAVAVNDAGFAESLLKLINASDNGGSRING